MDDQRRHQVSLGIGTGLALVSAVLPSLFPIFPQPVALGGLVFGLGFMLWGLWPYMPASASNWVRWGDGKLIPLRDAARKVYEAVEHTEMAQLARSNSQGDPDNVLHYFAEQILYRVPVRGKRLPSTQLAPVKDQLLFAHQFAGGGNQAVRTHDRALTYTDFCVTRKDLNSALESIKEEAR